MSILLHSCITAMERLWGNESVGYLDYVCYYVIGSYDYSYPTMLLALTNGVTKNARIIGMGMAGAAISDLILIGLVALRLGSFLRCRPSG